MEANYPAPPEIIKALRDNLKLRPLIRYVSTLKAVNSVPPSYRVFFHNNQFIDLYIEQTSIVAKIGAKSYWLMNMDETAEAIKAMNRVLTQPIPSTGEESDEGGEEDMDLGGEEELGEMDKGAKELDEFWQAALKTAAPAVAPAVAVA